MPQFGVETKKNEVHLTEDGLHLANSILWLDSHHNGRLSFLSSALSPLRTDVPQVITTEETSQLLEALKKKPKALICQYNRPFSIGNLKLELLPSGAILGGANLYLETEMGSLLYAPTAQIEKTLPIRGLQAKNSDTLILSANQGDTQGPPTSRKKNRDALLQAVQKMVHEQKAEVCTIICPPVATAQELTKLFSGEGYEVAVHPIIQKINRIHEQHGCDLGQFCSTDKTQVKPQIKILSYNGLEARKHLKAPGPFDLLVSPSQTTILHHPKIKSFLLPYEADAHSLGPFIQKVSPKRLIFFGPYAKNYTQQYKGLADEVCAAEVNSQPSLF